MTFTLTFLPSMALGPIIFAKDREPEYSALLDYIERARVAGRGGVILLRPKSGDVFVFVEASQA